MQGIIEALIIKFIVSEIAQRGAALDWADLKKSVHAKIEGAIPSVFWDTEFEKVSDALVDAASAAMKDSGGLSAVLTAAAARRLCRGLRRCLLGDDREAARWAYPASGDWGSLT